MSLEKHKVQHTAKPNNVLPGGQLRLSALLKTGISNALARVKPHSYKDEHLQDVIAVAAVLALSSRGLRPTPTKSSAADYLLESLPKRFFAVETQLDDSTDFALCLTSCLNSLQCKDPELLLTALQDELAKSLASPQVLALVADPLFVGWVYQVSIMGDNEYSRLREEKSLQSIARITQWFTPDWVCRFLIDEVFGDDKAISEKGRSKPHTLTFADTSCGAGHLTIPALKRLFERRVVTSSPREIDSSTPSILATILETELFALDLDPFLVSLTGFAIYLSCRDRIELAPLPIPQLFSFAPQSQVGSLGLTITPDMLLKRIDGKLVSAGVALPEKFDRQALNPPYLSHRLMPKPLATFLKENYKGSHYDLYAAFLELAIRLMSENGRVALICQQSFLSTGRYEEFRRCLVDRCRVDSIVQLGPGTFESRQGEKVNNAIISLSSGSRAQETATIKTYKLVSRMAKNRVEAEGLGRYEARTIEESSFLKAARQIPGFPFVPFCHEEVSALFQKYPALASPDNEVTLTNGLFTCDNKRFVRHFRDVEIDERSIYVPYDKGGGHKWYSTTPFLLKWIDAGEEIRQFRVERGQARALPGERFYFQDGITYSYIGTKGFKARLLSPGSVFDIASSAIFSERIDLHYLLGFLNSALVRYLLGMLNPTINFQIGDLRRIPFHKPTKALTDKIASLAHDAVELGRQADRFNPASPKYGGPLLELFNENRSGQGHQCLDSLQRLEVYNRSIQEIKSINQKETVLQNEIDDAIFDFYQISCAARLVILENEWVGRNANRLIAIPAMAKCEEELEARKACCYRAKRTSRTAIDTET